ncbi:hypothetical protein E3T55_05675 [Cryobacterium frigoriphilum]|uniref:Uncharacterized protein n=1 Tax=Cryobacterium frigoriphilum TaxID=1259150 RepID=A0A4R9A6Z9_9MICO|nr:hypothetical protein [Cryobacterium frigoriphilum]TFD53347.1 hypothetical protein E3T55_05675 [Cryobacterium frigoriphilum]
MTSRWARFARGWVVAVFSTLVAALSHTLGGGAAPSALAVAVSLAFAGMICVGLAGRTVSALRLGLSVVLSQVIFHTLFSFGGAGGALAVDVAATAGLHGHLAEPAVSIVPGAATAIAHAGHAGAAMWLAHLAAAAVTIIALRHGEQAFWGLLANARLGIRSVAPSRAALRVPVAVPTLLHRPPETCDAPAPRDLGVFLVTRPHRGPPVFVLCA